VLPLAVELEFEPTILQHPSQTFGCYEGDVNLWAIPVFLAKNCFVPINIDDLPIGDRHELRSMRISLG